MLSEGADVPQLQQDSSVMLIAMKKDKEIDKDELRPEYKRA
jgi:hypothetical protein